VSKAPGEYRADSGTGLLRCRIGEFGLAFPASEVSSCVDETKLVEPVDLAEWLGVSVEEAGRRGLTSSGAAPDLLLGQRLELVVPKLLVPLPPLLEGLRKEGWRGFLFEESQLWLLLDPKSLAAQEEKP